MARRSEADLLWEQFEQDQEMFDRSLLETIADMGVQGARDFVTENVPGPEGQLLLLQALRVKAERSPADFAEIASGGAWHRGGPHHDLLNDVFVDAAFNQRFYIISLPVRSGKASVEGTLIPTPKGFEKIEDILPGDYVFNEQGQSVKVLARHRFEDVDLYDVVFKDNTKITTHAEHEWTALSQRYRDNRRHNNKYLGVDYETCWEDNWWKLNTDDPRCKWTNRGAVTLTTAQIAETIDQGWGIPNALPLDLPSRELSLDPYICGYWLGDGRTNGPSIASHSSDHSHITSELVRCGYPWEIYSDNISVNSYKRIGSNLGQDLRSIGVLGNKHVPHEYLWASIEQRLALLQGLMDSDGGVESLTSANKHDNYVRTIRGNVSFTNTNKSLADAVYHLAVSLGEKPTRDERPAKLNGIATGKTAYRVRWSPYRFNPFRLPRKHDALDMFGKGHLGRGHRTIKRVQPAGKGNAYCIQVDSPSSLYLAGEQMIPTHNSEIMSKYAPAWYLSRFPEKNVLQITHTKSLATNFTRQTRDILMHSGPDLFGRTLGKSASSVEVFGYEGHSGRIVGMGVNGPIIGRGGHMIIVDDVYKDAIMAFSNGYNKKLKTWWADTLRGRLEPGGSIIVVLARWHSQDVAGWLLEQSRSTIGYDPWVEIKIPMIAEEDDVLGRKEGEVLWPERYNAQAVAQIKASTSPMTWAAQYQQSPLSSDNSLFPPEKWEYIKSTELPAIHALCRYWDLSAGGERSDYVAGVLMGGDKHGRLFILDVAHKKFTGPDADLQIERYVRETSTNDAKKYSHCRFYFEQTPGAGKTIATHYMRTVFAGLDAEPVIKQGAKDTNARIFSSQQMMGNVYIPIRPNLSATDEDDFTAPSWAQEFLEELGMFPDVKNDDQVDAASGAYIKLAELLENAGGQGLRVYHPDDVVQKPPVVNGNRVSRDLIERSSLARQLGIATPQPRSGRRARLYRGRVNRPSK